MRRYAGLLALVLLVCLLGGCKQDAAPEEELGQAVSLVRGGVAQEQAELAGVELAVAEGKPSIILSFTDAKGSAVNNLPEYTIKTLSSPYRISVEVSARHHGPELPDMDTALQSMASPVLDEGESGSPVPAGLFLRDCIIDGKATLYIQLDSPATFTAEEQAGRLIINLNMQGETEGSAEKYYACINAYDEYRYADMPPGMGELSPTLCVDKQRLMLISRPFDSQSDAQAEADRIQNVFDEENPGRKRTAKAVALKGGQRPEYIAGLYEEEIYRLKPALIDSQERSLPVVMPGGRLLDVSAAGGLLFAEAGFKEADSEAAISETLTILDADYNKHRLTALTDVYSIEDASFSPDGTGICILDGRGSATKLFYYNTQAKKLLSLSSSELEGVYDYVFADDSTVDTLGSSIARVAIEGDGFSADIVLEDASNVAGFGYAGGSLYYAEYQPSQEDGVCGIFALSDDGSQERVADGYRLSASPDGSRMACISDNGDNKIVINVLEGREEVGSMEGSNYISGMSWSPDSSILYYTEYTADGDYPNELIRWNPDTGQTERLLGILTSEFYCVHNDAIYVVMVQREGNYTVTYKLGL